MSSYLVGITGGIGSGKSTVSKILYHLGHKVYDSDLRAKDLMNKDESIKSQLINFFGKEVYRDSFINKDLLSKLIFGDLNVLKKINSIVHPVVSKDFEKWITNNSEDKILFKEAALLFESKSYKDLNHTIFISANKDLRIKRVLSRDKSRNISEIKKIIQNQIFEEEARRLADSVIDNNENSLLLPKVIKLLDKLTKHT